MTSRLQWTVIALAGAIGLGGGIYLGMSRTPGAARAGPQALEALYATTLPDLGLRAQPISQWKEMTLVVNFWATWCVPCREEIPGLIRLQSRYASKNLQIVGIALDSPRNVAEFAKSLGINYPVLIGGLDAINLSRTLGNTTGALPYTIVVSPGGAANRPHLGVLTEAELESLIAETSVAPKS